MLFQNLNQQRPLIKNNKVNNKNMILLDDEQMQGISVQKDTGHILPILIKKRSMRIQMCFFDLTIVFEAFS